MASRIFRYLCQWAHSVRFTPEQIFLLSSIMLIISGGILLLLFYELLETMSL